MLKHLYKLIKIFKNPSKTTIKKVQKQIYNKYPQDKVREIGLQSKYINHIIMFEDIMIN